MALGCALLLAACYLAAQAGMVRLRSDFFYYWVAGRMMLSGVSPHDPDAWPRVYFALTGTHSVDLAFPYPPWSVLAALPLALLEPDWAAALWMAASLGSLGLVTVLVLQDVPALRRLHAAGISALALAGFVPVVEVLFFGQLSSLLAAALLGASILERSGRRTLAAMLPAALMLKPQLGLVALPAVFLYLVSRGDRRAAATLCLSCAGIVLLSAPWLPAWIDHLGQSLQTKTIDAGRTPTIYGTTVLLTRSAGAPVAVAAALVLGAIVLAPVVALLRQHHQQGRVLSQALRTITPTTLALAPYLWTYDLSLLLASLLPACRDLLAQPGRKALVLAWTITGGSVLLSWLLMWLAALYRRETPSLLLPLVFALGTWLAVVTRGARGRDHHSLPR